MRAPEWHTRAGAFGLVLLGAALLLGAKPAAQSQKAAKAPAKPAAVRADSSGHPDFSGVWKLDVDRSVFGKIPGGQPAARTDSIHHDGTRLRQVLYLLNGARRDTTIYLYATNGTPTVNAVDGRDITSVVAWEGRVLHLHSTTKLLMMSMSLDERWQLAVDTRVLTMRRHVKYGFGEGDQTLVFERE